MAVDELQVIAVHHPDEIGEFDKTPIEPESSAADSDGTKMDSNGSRKRPLKIQLFLLSRLKPEPKLHPVTAVLHVGFWHWLDSILALSSSTDLPRISVVVVSNVLEDVKAVIVPFDRN
jgi:hypothetical protein